MRISLPRTGLVHIGHQTLARAKARAKHKARAKGPPRCLWFFSMEDVEPQQMQEMQYVTDSTWGRVRTRSMLDVVIEDTIYVHCQSAANTLPMSSAPRSHRALDYMTKSARKVMKVSCKPQNHLQVQVTKVTYQLQFPKWQLEKNRRGA